jgi:hypothetical protein
LFETRIREVVGSHVFSPEWDYSWFSRNLPANARIRLGRFLSNPFEFIIRQSSLPFSAVQSS